jgi:hypothetical protein
MTHGRALGLAGILGLMAVLTGCAGSDDANDDRAASLTPPAAPIVAGYGDPGGADVATSAGPATPSPSPGAPGRAEGEALIGVSPAGAEGAPALPTSDADSTTAGAEGPVGRPPPQQIPAGTLTAGTWDDNRNLARFLDYRAGLQQQGMRGLLDFTAADHEAAQPLGTPQAHTTLDVSLVIDTTGSMGDELAYLQTEFLAISSKIEASYPSAEQRWSLVVYRDEGDVYTTRSFDFGSDPVVFRQRLAEQGPGGGGDFPEAPDAAFQAMNQLSWRDGEATARLAFWVADAPHHDTKAGALKNAIEAAQAEGVHIYPVASSGVDELTELTMRSAAQLTGGRYLFLTDDSGVGGAHKEPSIPCYFVTKLDAAILRMVDIEMTGTYREPTREELVRAGGDPQDGACTLESGQTVFVF